MIERDFDVPFVADLALREKQIQQNYRPIMAVHKWFARGPGTLFRALILSEFVKGPLRDEFYQGQSLKTLSILDPFMGGGTTVVEALRLGCTVTGIDLNPVAWFIVKTEVEPVATNELDAAFDCLKSFPQVAPKYENVSFDRELSMRKKKCELFGIGHPFIDALLGYLQNAPFTGDAACLSANGVKHGVVEARYRVTWDRADQGSSSTVIRVAVNGEAPVDEFGYDAERLETGRYLPTQSPPAIPVEVQSRAEEAVRLWTASRRTEMPEGTIVRCELLGVSAAT